MAPNKRIRRRLILLFVLAFAILVTGIAGYFFTQWNRERQIEVASTRGLEAYRSGDYVAALPLLSKAVAARRQDLELALALGHSRLRNTDPNGRHLTASEKYFLHALSLDPKNEEALRELVRIYVATGDTTDALAYSDRLPGDDIDVITSRATVLRLNGRFDEALDEIGSIRKFAPNDSTWPLYEFTLRGERGDSGEEMLAAIEAYEADHPNNQGLALVRVSVLRSSGRVLEAARLARELINLPDIDEGIVVQLLDQLDALEMTSESRRMLERAVEIASVDPDVAGALVQRLWRRSQFREAIELALQANTNFPDEVEFLRQAADAAVLLGDREGAEAIYERLLEASTADDTARAQIDEMVLEVYRAGDTGPGELQDRLERIREARRFAPSNRSLALLEAETLERTGLRDAAIELYRDSFERTLSRQAGLELVDLLLRVRRYEEALQQSERLFGRYPNLESYLSRARAWIAIRQSGGDPFLLEGTGDDRPTIADRIRGAYVQTGRTAPEASTVLLPLLAAAAVLDEERSILEFAIDEALAHESISPSNLIQIANIRQGPDEKRIEELLTRAEELGAGAIEIGFARAEQARLTGDSEQVVAILDGLSRLPELDEPGNEAYLRRILTYLTDAEEGPGVLERMASILDRLPEDHEAATIVISFPGIWSSDPELANRALDQIERLVGRNSDTYVIAEARRAASAEMIDEAERSRLVVALNDLVRRSPGSVGALLVLSDLLRTGADPDWSASATFLRRVLELRPDQVGLYPTAIQLHQRIGDRDRAIEYLQRYQALAGDSAAARRRVALFVAQGLGDQAIEELELIADDSGSALDRISLAMFLARENRIEEALDQYEIALGIEPANRFAFDGRLILLATTGRLDEALAIAQRSDLLDERQKLTLRIELLLAAGEIDAASRVAGDLLEAHAEHVGTWLVVSRVRSENGDDSGSRNALRQALEIDPENAIALGQLVNQLASDPAAWTEARGLLPQLREEAPVVADVLELRMRAADPVTGRFTPDQTDLDDALALVDRHPTSVSPHRLAWTLHSVSGDHEQALQIARGALLSVSGDPEPALWGCESASALGDWETALELAATARDLSPTERRLDHALRLADLALRIGRDGTAYNELAPYLAILDDDEALLDQLPLEGRRMDGAERAPDDYRRLLLRALLRTGRLDAATNRILPLLTERPELALIWVSTARGLDPSLARPALERLTPVLELETAGRLTLGNAWLSLARSSEDPRDAERARALLTSLVEPGSPVRREGLLYLAQLARVDSGVEASNDLYRELIAAFDPREIDGFRTREDRRDEGRLAIDRRIYLAALNNLAFQLIDGDAKAIEESEGLIETALQLSVDELRPELLSTRASLLRSTGDREGALESLLEAIEADQTRLDLRISAVEILVALGRMDKARSIAGQGLDLGARYGFDPAQVELLRTLVEGSG